MDSASLCILAGRYYNPIPTRFLTPIDCSKIPAQVVQRKERLRDRHSLYGEVKPVYLEANQAISVQSHPRNVSQACGGKGQSSTLHING